MKVTVLAQTRIDGPGITDFVGEGTRTAQDLGLATAADDLAEVAGRACYKAYSKPNPATEFNAGYLNNILTQGHFSVLEHASVTFGVQGVSRALLVELERHRFLSFSVESQRYVDTAYHHPEPVYPPAMERSVYLRHSLNTEYQQALENYRYYVEHLSANGLSRKEAREAARAVLPNCTPVDFIVTGNIRCWRDVIGKRYHPSADAEIRQFAGEVLSHLRRIAPHSVQDIEDI